MWRGKCIGVSPVVVIDARQKGSSPPKRIRPFAATVSSGSWREVGKGAEIRCLGVSPQLCFAIIQPSRQLCEKRLFPVFSHMGRCLLARCLLHVAFGGLLRRLPWEGFPAAYAFF